MKPESPRFVPKKKPDAPAAGGTVPDIDDKDNFQPAAPASPGGARPPVKPETEEAPLAPRGPDNTSKKIPGKLPETDPIPVEPRAEMNVQPLNLGEKIAWGAPARRTIRRDIRPQFANARLIRIPAYPSNDWIPQVDTATIAKK